MRVKVYSKNEAFENIKSLVNHFDNNLKQIKVLEHGKESQVEDNYIKPIFRFLNWTNEGLDIGRQEFVVRPTQKVEGRSKIPDYLLQTVDAKTGRMQKWLYMEAKHPKHNIMENLSYIRQAYQYAHSTLSASALNENRVRFAVLTDFEHFRLFDCINPEPLEKNNLDLYNQQIIEPFDWHYSNYLSDFDLLWDTFERNNVASGSLRGLKVSIIDLAKKKIAPDMRFLNDLKKWRLEIARNIFKNNKDLSEYQLTVSSQLLLDRIVFVKTLSDRGIEDDYLGDILQSYKNTYKDKEFYIFDECIKLFNKFDGKYNGSVFAHSTDLDNVRVENKTLFLILDSLRPEKSVYTLRAMPIEIIGSIYEQFLGEEIKRKGKGLQSVVKKEFQKTKGAYYTPAYIVDYIVENTVGKLLEKCKSPDDVSKIKILDPACGSGSFLIAAYGKILEWYKRYFENMSKSGNKLFYKKNEENVRVVSTNDNDFIELRPHLKNKILLDNIFGVDIDERAVEVAKFSLSLKALEEEDYHSVNEQYRLFNEQILIDLSRKNILSGNSLIGTDFYNNHQMSLLDKEEKFRLNAFDWDREFTEIITKGGFSAVIGNPPYVRVRIFREFYPLQVEYLISHYSCAIHSWDIYLLFFERATQIACLNGRCSFIVPIQTLHQPNCESLRRCLLTGGSLVSIANLTKLKVFQKAIVKNCIITWEKRNAENNMVDIMLPQSEYDLFNKPIRKWPQKNIVRNPGLSFKFELLSHKKQLTEKLRSMSWELNDLCYVTFGLRSCAKGKGEGDKNRLITEDSRADQAKPYLEGRNINRYVIYPTKRYIRYISKEMYSPRRPEMFETKKIISQSMLSKMRLIATLDESKYYVEQSLVCIIPHGILTYQKSLADIPLEFILGIINSNLESFYFKTSIIDYALGGGLIHATPGSQKKLIIPCVQKSQTDNIVSLVKQLLILKDENREAKTEREKIIFNRQIDAIDNQIDSLVYDLYGITDSERKIIEESLNEKN